jgi:DNA repair exonuclease SbcCD ATPase subunit
VGRGYKEVVFDGLNRYFVAEEHGDLAEAIAAPPNIFDDFTVLRHHFSVRGVAAEFDLTLAEIKESLVQAKEELNTGQLRIEELEATATALTTERERIDSDLAAEKAKVMDFAAELERVREMFAEQLAAERTDAAAVQAELEHRISSITEEMATAGQENHRKVAELEESLSETREALSASGQELDRVRASVEAHRSVALEADALIRRAAQSRRGRWHQFGEAIGLVRPQQVWRALSDWSLPDI